MQIENLNLNLDDKKLELFINNSSVYSKTLSDSDTLDCLESVKESTINTYQQRVLNEKKELDEKIQKLESFLDNDLFKNLNETERNLLKSHLGIMSIYSDILKLRINLFIK